MVLLSDFTFKVSDDEVVEMRLYKYYFCVFENNEVEDIGGEFTIADGKLIFTKFDERRNNIRLWRLINKGLRRLVFRLNNHDAVFLDEDIGVPLFGLNYIGVVDKGSEMIEVKPLTGCNANCTFCSVDEGIDSKKEVDFVVDKDYLVKELFALLDIKENNNNQIWVNPHGDPTLYAPLVEFVREVKEHSKVSEVMIITNGMLLGKTLADNLKEAGLTTVSVSISASNKELGKTIMGTPGYDVDVVIKNISYAADIGLNVIVAPVYIKGYNDKEMIDIIKKVQPFANKISIQKFCHNKMGRNPIKEQDWDSFFEELKDLQDHSGFTLIEPLEKLRETNTYEQPFQRGDIVEVDLKGYSRFKRDKIGVVSSRAIQVMRCHKLSGKKKVKIMSAKNNIFVAS